MKTLNSNAKDCYQLAIKLKRILKVKIEFEDSIYTNKISGKYYLDVTNKLAENIIDFNFEYSKNKFLKIHFLNNDTTAKLSALSDFYLIFSELFNEPTLFYRIKNNNTFTIEWRFEDIESTIEYLKQSNYIEDLVIFKMNKDINKVFKDSIGLPYPLLYLLVDNNNSLKLQKR